jgi:murein hydrolase activator
MIDFCYSMISIKKLFVGLFIIIFAFSAQAQSRKEKLEKEKLQIENEINYTNQLLNSTKTNRANSLQELILINNKIEQRARLISNYSSEIDELDQIIKLNNTNIKSFETELKQARTEYAQLINYVFRNQGSTDRLMYIFAAENFNQAYQRLKYLQYYSQFRKSQALKIEQMKDSLSSMNQMISSNKQDKLVVLGHQQKEAEVLEQDKKQKNTKISNLAKQESQLRKTIRQKRSEANRLNKAISDIISEEIKAAAATAKETGSEKRSSIIALTPSEFQLTNSFSKNKGKLPWPSEHGVVSSTFGEHDHPVLKRIKVKNNGIDVLTNKGENARAVFDGKVISVRTITNSNVAVIVRHGEYFTVYSNLAEAFVKTGDAVRTKQALGIVYTNPSEAKTELHFEIWKGKVLLNPQYWVVK